MINSSIEIGMQDLKQSIKILCKGDFSKTFQSGAIQI